MTNMSNREKGDKPTQPLVVLIGTEGKETEPQFFNIVIRRRRINSGRASVHIVKDKGQHKQLINEIVDARATLASKLKIDPSDIECWAVCDKDKMPCTLQELEEYAAVRGVSLAFSDPQFETYLLQHLVHSATNLTGRQLIALLDSELKKRGVTAGYKKTDLSWFDKLLDDDPLSLEFAIHNSSQMTDKESTPYLTVHNLMQRLIDIANS